MHPQFTLTPNPAAIKRQLNAWALIQQISDLIKLEAVKEHWDNVITLADKRERMVANFFAEPLCMDLYDTVISDIELMKDQHVELIESLAESQNVMGIIENELATVRSQVRSSLNKPDDTPTPQ